jgi:molybdopterin-guanine dinucleotide biosynthesis adapter protein
MGKYVIPVISVIGRTNTGKTTLLERLIPALRSRGLRIGTVKHHARDFEIDREGKDSYRHKKAGASVSMITSPEKIGLVADVTQELTLSELVGLYMRDINLVITEGYKREHMPKLEVYVYQEGLDPLAKQDPDVIAIIADQPIQTHVPVFLRDDPEAIADFIVERLGVKDRSKAKG